MINSKVKWKDINAEPKGRVSEKYLTLNLAASLLHVHAHTVKRWLREGRLKGYRISERKVLISRQDVEKFIKESTINIKNCPTCGK